jgi:hypothetical protein
MKKKKHPGGAPPKDPVAGNRKLVSMRLHPDTISKLKKNATKERSQSEIVDDAVDKWQPPRK